MTLAVFTVCGTRSVSVTAVDTGIVTSYNKYRYTCKYKEKSVPFAFLQSVLNNFSTQHIKEKNNIRQRKKQSKETISGFVTHLFHIFFENFKNKNGGILSPCFALEIAAS